MFLNQKMSSFMHIYNSGSVMGDPTNAIQAVQQFYNNQHYEMACAGTIGIKENENSKATIQVFPNPAKGEFTITNYELQITNVELYDVLGKKVTSHTSYRTPHTTVNISHLPAGIYFYRAVLQDHSIHSGKIMVIAN
jgi:hypothetical protein